MRSRLPFHAIPGYERCWPENSAAAAKATVLENPMANEKGPNIKKRPKCKNCEGKGTLKKGERVVKCQRCGGTGVR